MARTSTSTPLKTYGADGGLDRVGEAQPAGWAFHLPDALGSVRQLTDVDAAVTLAQSYEPFGSVMASSGLGETNYSFTGEWADGTELVYLRARYYLTSIGRFLSRDTWQGVFTQPNSFNPWLYAYANPLRFLDPTGLCSDLDGDGKCDTDFHCDLIPDPTARRLCHEAKCDMPKYGEQCPTHTSKPIRYANKESGELFKSLIRLCPGWWHDTNQFEFNMYDDHDVERLGLAFEVRWEAHNQIWNETHFDAFIEAVAHKYWLFKEQYSVSLFFPEALVLLIV